MFCAVECAVIQGHLMSVTLAAVDSAYAATGVSCHRGLTYIRNDFLSDIITTLEAISTNSRNRDHGWKFKKKLFQQPNSHKVE